MRDTIKKVVGFGTLLNVLALSLLVLVAAPRAAQATVTSATTTYRFYRKGTAPPGELCPIFCEYRPCCPPPEI